MRDEKNKKKKNLETRFSLGNMQISPLISSRTLGKPNDGREITRAIRHVISKTVLEKLELLYNSLLGLSLKA